MAQTNKNNKNTNPAPAASNGKKASGALKTVVIIVVVLAIVAGAISVIVGSLKKNPSEATDPFLAVARESKTASVNDDRVKALSAVHATVFGTNALELNGSMCGKDISLTARYGKDLLSSSVYLSYGKNVEALLFDGQYYQYDGGDSVTVAYPAPLLSNSKSIVAAIRSDFITLFPDLSTTPEFYNIVSSDVNGSIQTAATLIGNKYLSFNALNELFNANKTVMAQFFFGTEYKGSMPDLDVLYKTAADFMINGISEKSLSVKAAKSGRQTVYSINGNLADVTAELIEYLNDNKTAKLMLGNEFYEKLMVNLKDYTDARSADKGSADFSGEITTEKGFVTSVRITSNGKDVIALTVSDINKAVVKASRQDEVNSRAENKTVIDDKDSFISFLKSKIRV